MAAHQALFSEGRRRAQELLGVSDAVRMGRPSAARVAAHGWVEQIAERYAASDGGGNVALLAAELLACDVEGKLITVDALRATACPPRRAA